MLSNDYDIGAAFRAIEEELIASMIRNLDRHRAEEEKLGYNWSMWQTEQLKSLEKYKKENQAKYPGKFKNINSRIEQLLHLARTEGNMSQEITILNTIKNGFRTKRPKKGATAEFFKLNDRKLNALIKATTADVERAETAVLRRAEDQYRKIIYNAQVYANTGAGTYEKAVDMATRDFLKKGIDCVEYANGSRHTISDYADMAIRTASKRAYLQGEGEKRQEWKISTVIVNKRGNPCPKCLPHCGKVYIDDVWSGGPKDGKSPVTGAKYPLLSKAIEGGLYHPRCKDSHSTYFEGVSTPPSGSKYTKEELNELADKYAAEQKQQYARRQEEKYSRLEKYALDPENKDKYQSRAKAWGKLAGARESGRLSATKHVEGIPDHEEPKRLGKLDVDDQNMILQLIQSYERQVRTLEIETACVVTKTGEVYECFGTEDQVFPNIDLGEQLEDAIVSHNHPDDVTEYSFSDDDFQLFMDYHLQILRGFDKMYTYELSRIDLTVDEPSGTGLFDMVPEEYRHMQVIKMAKEAGIGYRR